MRVSPAGLVLWPLAPLLVLWWAAEQDFKPSWAAAVAGGVTAGFLLGRAF